MTLREMVAAVNAWPTRPTKRDMTKVVQCRFCDVELPVQTQDHALAKSKGSGSVCGGQACRQRLTDEYNAAKAASRKRRKAQA